VAAIKEMKTATGFKAIANDYLDFAERKYVKDLYHRKANVFRRFRLSLPDGDIPIDQITPRHIHDYLKSFESNSVYNEHRHELSALFNWAIKIYSAQVPFLVNPYIGVEAMTHVTIEKTIPTGKEALDMIAASNAVMFVRHAGDERDILLVCLQTLGRIDEVLRLRWTEDVNFDKRYVTLWTRKRRNGAYEPDMLPMNQDLYDVLWSRWNDRKQDRWVFYNEKKETRYKHRPRMMDFICKRAGCTPIGTRKIMMTPSQIRAF
jgi:integrase